MQRLAILLLGLGPLIAAAALPVEPSHGVLPAEPAPDLAPARVVRIQVAALRGNSLLNEGIELTYRFASPANKRLTGPLDRFIDMVRSHPYRHLLNHRSARYGPLTLSSDQAHQMVIVTDNEGEEVAYHWMLTRQTAAPFKDCWMTRAVIPAQRDTQRALTQLDLPPPPKREPHRWLLQ